MSTTSPERPYLLSTLTAAAGVAPVTFNAWRARNDLFPRTKGAKGWNRFSLAEIYTTYCVAGLTRQGLSAQIACDLGMALLPVFEQNEQPILLAETGRYVRLDWWNYRNAEGADLEIGVTQHHAGANIGDLGQGPFGQIMIIDMIAVMSNVLSTLNDLGAEGVMSSHDIGELVLEAADKVLGQSKLGLTQTQRAIRSLRQHLEKGDD